MTDSKKYSSKLLGQQVLIIGGSSGMGYGVAEASLEFGADVTIASSSPPRIEAAIASLQKSYPSAKDRIHGIPCDLNTPDLETNIVSLFTQVCGSEASRKLDHIIFTATGGLALFDIATATVPNLQVSAMVRFNGPILVAKHASTYLNPGPNSSITLTSGSVGDKPLEHMAIGSAHSAGLYGIMRGVALDLRPVRCNVVSPGLVDTPLFDQLKSMGQWEELKEKYVGKMATGSVGRVEDVVEAFMYSMKDRNTTGSVISSNGGSLLMS